MVGNRESLPFAIGPKPPQLHMASSLGLYLESERENTAKTSRPVMRRRLDMHGIQFHRDDYRRIVHPAHFPAIFSVKMQIYRFA